MHMTLINTALTHAQRVVHTLPWGDVVWHVWRASEGAQGLLHGTARAIEQEPVSDSSVVREPLVLLHGGSGSWTHWVKNVLHLSQTRDVWGLDLPGFGDSTLPPDVRDADD